MTFKQLKLHLNFDLCRLSIFATYSIISIGSLLRNQKNSLVHKLFEIFSLFFLHPQTQPGTQESTSGTAGSTTLLAGRVSRQIWQRGNSSSPESMRRTCTAPAPTLFGTSSILDTSACSACTQGQDTLFTHCLVVRDIHVFEK